MRKALRRLHYLLHRDRLSRELADEMSAHREMMAADRRRAFGNTAQLRDQICQIWGWLRALDEETGKVLWTATLPAGSEGIPAMYEVKGRQYLVIPASANINSGGGHPGSRVPKATPSDQPKGYVAFALSEK